MLPPSLVVFLYCKWLKLLGASLSGWKNNAGGIRPVSNRPHSWHSLLSALSEREKFFTTFCGVLPLDIFYLIYTANDQKVAVRKVLLINKWSITMSQIQNTQYTIHNDSNTEEIVKCPENAKMIFLKHM